ncbi:MAG: CRISPR-associated CARF protein Csx1 [Candidatus Hadarchaeales archaeon]
MRSILVSSWGKPWRTGGEFSWKKVEYRLKETSRTSRSSLPVLVEHIKPERIVIVVLDTVAEKICSNYQKLCKMVEERYLDFIQKELEILEEVKVIVTPGVGSFELKFKGEMMDFYHYVFFELSRELIGLEKQCEVHLDITHGLNFAPVLLHEALENILGILAYTKNIKFSIYNAEPFIPETKEKSSLTIHRIEYGDVYPSLSPNRLGGKGEARLLAVREEHKKDTEFCKKVSKAAKVSNSKELNAFLSGIVNGLPLCLYTFCPNPQRLEKKLFLAVKEWRKNVEIRSGEVERKVSFTPDFTNCVKLWLAAKSFNIERKEAVVLEELEERMRKIFGYERSKEALISHELAKIKEEAEAKKKELNKWKLLRTLFSGERISPSFDRRNFLAHAGLEYNVTELRYSGKLELRYRKNQRKELANHLEGLLH